ncbi:MAG TPA: hypothetical protein PKL73_03580 [Polyangiaceae bacterium]|nr:MAG: hypothetical protein BWY17_02089 [Deltaproteobacteria bacterium ADurb.Bin207]HNS96007.1 hypothetical protein [Polyangiaceae bacterium]HNZ22326.1 hypothetical protein [Polyangiaceae bacterium]HOD20860.1 hypothetical protein [Polyangiaceae bacterium]HOE49102.1 hypothetical protein [Polyangiaceae bacterium]
MTSTPLLSLHHARIDRDGSLLCENIDLEIDGPRVVVAGPGADAVLEAICMTANVSKGHVRISGYDVSTRSHVGRVGIAPSDLPLPQRMSVEQYLILYYRTLGFSKREANHATMTSLSDLGLTHLASRQSNSLTLSERKAVTIAAAMLPNAPCLVAHSPLRGIEKPESHGILSVLGQVANRRQVLVSTSRWDAEGVDAELMAGATHIAFLSRHATLWSGPTSHLFSEGKQAALLVSGTDDAFVRALAQQGFDPTGKLPRIVVRIDDPNGTSRLLSIANEYDVAIIQMIPLWQPPRAPSSSEPEVGPNDQEPPSHD